MWWPCSRKEFLKIGEICSEIDSIIMVLISGWGSAIQDGKITRRLWFLTRIQVSWVVGFGRNSKGRCDSYVD